MRLFTEELLSKAQGLSVQLIEKIKAKKSLIGIVGLGYVGMPIAMEFCKRGFACIGVDVSEEKVNDLNDGINFIEDLDDQELAEMVKMGLLKGSTSYEVLQDADVIFICVPTPFNPNKDPDLSYILAAGEGIAPILSPGKLVILKSTTFPGTTEDYLLPRLKASGLNPGLDFFLAFSPERVDPGNKVYHTGNTPIVVGGLDETSSLLAGYVNNQIIEEVYLVDNPKVAELEKLLENIFRSVNIALVNELALLCERLGGINVWEVIESASTKPFGFMKFTPGPGVGGHCIPIDPYYLSWLAREYDFETKFITLAANVNESMPYHVAQQVIKEVAKQPIALTDAKILILGVSFKKNVRDLRHSPAEAIIYRLIEEGIENIEICDPWAPVYEVSARTFHSVELDPDRIASYSCIVMVTDHDVFDIAEIVKHARAVIDTRNMTRNIQEGREKIRLLGHTSPKKKMIPQH